MVRYHIAPMRRHRAPLMTHRQPNWLLVCAMLALSVHALANMGLMPTRGHATQNQSTAFFAEICTGKGMLRAGSTTSLRGLVDAAGDEIDCCELTSFTTGPGLTSSPRALAVLESASGARLAARLVEVPAFIDWALPSPRGPPLLG